MQLAQGTTLQNGRFRIISCIGDGGFGITYLAMDERLRREVVLKEYFPDFMVKRDTTVSFEVQTLSTEYSNDFHEGIKKFLKEAMTLAQFNYVPAIADVYDFFEENNTAYIVMDYIKGQNLKQHIRARQTPYTFSEAMGIITPCMEALEQVHQAGIIHRDFAPDNILIDEKGKVKIIDFGSSRDFVTNNATMTIMVKHGYAPAEQYSNAVKQGPYTDVYSLGAILYEMLTLKKPMPAVDRMFKDTLLAPMAVNPLITEAQSAVVMKGLSVSYETRYQNVDEFLNALQSVEAGNTTCIPVDNTPLNNAPVNYAQVNNIPVNNAQISNVYSNAQNQMYNDSATEMVRPEQVMGGYSEATEVVSAAQQMAYAEQMTDVQMASNNQPAMSTQKEAIVSEQNTPLNKKSKGKQKKSKKGLIVAAVIALLAIFAVIGLMKPSLPKEAREIQDRIKKCDIGDTVKFGDYEWQLLAKEDDKALVVTTEPVFYSAYDLNMESDSITWEGCSLRKNLNEDFCNEFSENEQLLIVASNLKNEDNSVFGTSGGNDTEDKVFLLSIDEAEKYFADNKARSINEFWFLRSPGKQESYVAGVGPLGDITGIGANAFLEIEAVRPAMWINLK